MSFNVDIPPLGPSIPLDPVLSGFPTQGPNDQVPQGFRAIPYSMIPSFITAGTAPEPSYPGPPSGGDISLQTLTTMMLALDKRLKLQESQRNIAYPNNHALNSSTLIEGTTNPEEQQSIPTTRPMTWPDRVTPAQTSRQTTQETGGPEVMDTTVGAGQYLDIQEKNP